MTPPGCSRPRLFGIPSALELNAAAVILAHNHPSGVPEPSEADKALTRRLRDALDLIEVRVLDHFVIGGAQAVSFSEGGGCYSPPHAADRPPAGPSRIQRRSRAYPCFADKASGRRLILSRYRDILISGQVR